MQTLLQIFVVRDETLLSIYLIDRLCVYLFVIELCALVIFRTPVFIMAHVPFLIPYLHILKKSEWKVRQYLFPTKVRIIDVPKQPFI